MVRSLGGGPGGVAGTQAAAHPRRGIGGGHLAVPGARLRPGVRRGHRGGHRDLQAHAVPLLPVQGGPGTAPVRGPRGRGGAGGPAAAGAPDAPGRAARALPGWPGPPGPGHRPQRPPGGPRLPQHDFLDAEPGRADERVHRPRRGGAHRCARRDRGRPRQAHGPARRRGDHRGTARPGPGELAPARVGGTGDGGGRTGPRPGRPRPPAARPRAGLGRAAGLLEAHGYEDRGSSWLLEIALTGEPVVPALPDGITIRPFRPGDEHATYRLTEDAFNEWPERRPRGYDEWARYNIDRPAFAPAFSPLAFDGDRLVGAALSPDRDRTAGYVHSVAVHREYRHRGIARALLRQAFLGFHRQGRRTCALWTHSGTGALTLYQRIGMTVRQRSTHYSKALTST